VKIHILFASHYQSGAQAGMSAHWVRLSLGNNIIFLMYILHAANVYSISGGHRLNASWLNTGLLSTNLSQLSLCLRNAKVAFHTVLFTNSELTCNSWLSLLRSHKHLPVFQHLLHDILHISAATYHTDMVHTV